MFSLETRKRAIAAYLDKKSVKSICDELRISRSCLYNWIKLYSKRNEPSTNTEYTYSRIVALRKKLDKLAREYEILQAAYECLKPSLSQKLEIANKLKGRYPTKQMCRVLGVNHATFYNHDRRRVLVTKNELRDDLLKEKITQIYNESGGRFGANKIFQKLQGLGIRSSLGKVSSLMKELKLKSKRRNSPIAHGETPKTFYDKNKLEQKFNQAQPNKFWTGDVTCIIIGKNRYYLCVVMELFSRKILAYELSSRNGNSLTVNTFKRAFEARARPQGLTFHSDQGSNYKSEQYVDLLKTLKVEQSFSKRGTPYDNAAIEAFFSNLKRDDLYSRHFEHFDDLIYAVKDYIEYYNSYRPHAALGFKTPDQAENEYFALQSPTTGGEIDT